MKNKILKNILLILLYILGIIFLVLYSNNDNEVYLSLAIILLCIPTIIITIFPRKKERKKIIIEERLKEFIEKEETKKEWLYVRSKKYNQRI